MAMVSSLNSIPNVMGSHWGFLRNNSHDLMYCFKNITLGDG